LVVDRRLGAAWQLGASAEIFVSCSGMRPTLANPTVEHWHSEAVETDSSASSWLIVGWLGKNSTQMAQEATSTW
jgi:hypothetical protein